MCDFCKPLVDETAMLASGNVIDGKNNIHISAFISDDVLFFTANFLSIHAKIFYCPICGSKLAPHKGD